MTRHARRQPHLPFPLPAPEVRCGDAFKWLAGIRSESVDLVITDPPYSTLERHRAWGTTTRLKRAWFPVIQPDAYPHLLAELYRILKPDTHCYLFADAETMFVVKPVAEGAGFRFWKPLVWDRVMLGLGYHYRARYEFIMFFSKGTRTLNSRSYPDVLGFKQSRRKDRYPTEKPVELLRVLVEQSSDPRDVVVDPFCGGGSTGVAATSMGREFRGCDVSPDAVARTIAGVRGALKVACAARAQNQ